MTLTAEPTSAILARLNVRAWTPSTHTPQVGQSPSTPTSTAGPTPAAVLHPRTSFVVPPRAALYGGLAGRVTRRAEAQESITHANVHDHTTQLPAAATRPALLGAPRSSLIVAAIQGPPGMRSALVQVGLPLVQTVPTWRNLYRCVDHMGGPVADALRQLPNMASMTIATAAIPEPLLVVMSGGGTQQANFCSLGLHPVACDKRVHPAPPSPQTQDILERHGQPVDTPVYIIYIYGQASLPRRHLYTQMFAY